MISLRAKSLSLKLSRPVSHLNPGHSILDSCFFFYPFVDLRSCHFLSQHSDSSICSKKTTRIINVITNKPGLFFQTTYSVTSLFCKIHYNKVLIKTVMRAANQVGKKTAALLTEKTVSSGSSMTQTKVCNVTTQPFVKSYAKRSFNEPEANSPDPQALFNNPPVHKNSKVIRHVESHRESCDKQDCLTKDCSTLCGNPIALVATGHATHGNPPVEPGKKTIPVSQTDLNGKPKPQNMVFYDTPHSTSKTPEHVQGTQKLKNDQNMKNIIMNHEDKK